MRRISSRGNIEDYLVLSSGRLQRAERRSLLRPDGKEFQCPIQKRM